jgi:superfamily II DNA/RNA helicase
MRNIAREDTFREIAELIERAPGVIAIRGPPGSGKTFVALKTVFHWFLKHKVAFYVTPSVLLCRQFAENAKTMRLTERVKPLIYTDDDDDGNELRFKHMKGLYIMTYHSFSTLHMWRKLECLIVFDEVHVVLESFYMQPTSKLIMEDICWKIPRLLLTSATCDTLFAKLVSVFDIGCVYHLDYPQGNRRLRYLNEEQWITVLKNEIARLAGTQLRNSGIVVFLAHKADVERLYEETSWGFHAEEVHLPMPTIAFTKKRKRDYEILAYEAIGKAIITLAPLGIHYIHARVGREYADYVFDELRNNRVKVLIATSYAAVGMNFGSIDHVFIRLDRDPQLTCDEEILKQMCGRAGRNGRIGEIFICKQERAPRARKTQRLVTHRIIPRSNSWKIMDDQNRCAIREERFIQEERRLKKFTECTGLTYSQPKVQVIDGIVRLMEPEILLCYEIDGEQILQILDVIESIELTHVFPIAQILFYCIIRRFREDAFTHYDTCTLLDKRGELAKYYTRVKKILEGAIEKYFKRTELRVIFTIFMYTLYEFVDHSAFVWLRHIRGTLGVSRTLRHVIRTHGRRFEKLTGSFRAMEIIADGGSLQEHDNVIGKLAVFMAGAPREVAEYETFAKY